MRVGVLFFTDAGEALFGRLEKAPGYNWVVRQSGEKARDFVESQWNHVEGFVFIGAVGIAVRMIAPYVTSKDKDPAVVVMDEQGRYAIPVLSGHLGGANELAQELAAFTGALPVITTATDLNGVFAVDVWAKKHQCRIGDITKIKCISGALLKGDKVGISSDFPIKGTLPDGLEARSDGSTGICVSLDGEKKVYPETLPVIPQIVTVGVGCRKNTDPQLFERFLLETLSEKRISPLSVKAVASIDLKKDEPCILNFCRKYGLRFLTYTPEQLRAVSGEFTPSAFVSSITGVDNVCERSAVCAGGSLIMNKKAEQGMTVALAAENWSCEF